MTAKDDHPRSWDYRVCVGTAANATSLADEGEEIFTIIEVYYNDAGEIVLWSDNVGALGESPEELRRDLQCMIEAIDRPLLSEADLPRAEQEEFGG
jgi:hypothetical protein